MILKNDVLALRSEIESSLKKIETVETAVDYYNKLHAFKVLIKSQKQDSIIQNLVAVQKIRVERMIGNFVNEGQAKGEIEIPGGNLKRKVVTASNHVNKKNLADIGLTKRQSMKFKKLTLIPEEDFEEAIRKNNEAVEDEQFEITTSRMLRFADTFAGPDPKHVSEKIDSFDRHKLISLRNERGFTQYSLALSTLVEASTISRIEKGVGERPSYDTVARLSECLNVAMEYFKIKPQIL